MSLGGGPELEGNPLMGWGFGWFLENAPSRLHPRTRGHPPSRSPIATDGPWRGFRAAQPRCPALTLGLRARVAAVQRGAERRGAAGWGRARKPHPHPPQHPPARCAELQGGMGVVSYRLWLAWLSLNGRYGLKCVLCLQLVALWV